MKIIQNTLKIEKFSDDPKFFREGPQKVGLVGFPETIQFFFFGLTQIGHSTDCAMWPSTRLYRLVVYKL